MPNPKLNSLPFHLTGKCFTEFLALQREREREIHVDFYNVVYRLSNPPDFRGIFLTITQIPVPDVPNSGIIQIPIVEKLYYSSMRTRTQAAQKRGRGDSIIGR